MTSETLGPYVWGTEVFEPARYLAESGFQIMALSPAPGRPWRYLQIRASAPGNVRSYLFDDYIDLSQGSPDREIVALLCEQNRIPVRWVNEGLEIAWPLEPRHTANWRAALADTEGVSAKAWKEEIEELRWEASASYRPGIPRPRPYRPRSVKPLEGVTVPFFAKRTGQIPKNGRPDVNGVTLPIGTRRPERGAAYWATDKPADDLAFLIHRLADMFTDTGLWPVVWSFPDAPEGYLGGGHHEIDGIDEINVEDLLVERWSRYRSHIGGVSDLTDFPGLAAAQPRTENQSPDPWPAPVLTGPAYLLLVPCNRPADAVTALGGIGAVTPAPVTSAVLRSWEERFGAVFYQAEPEVTRVAVARPPQHRDQAVALAAELYALNPRLGDLDQTASALLGGDPPPSAANAGITATDWNISWSKDVW